MPTANVVDVSEYQPTTIDFEDLKKQGVKAVIVRLGHGTTQDKNAASHLANAKQAGLLVHGYHYYEGADGEVAWSLKNAQNLGLATSAYYFLDMEGDIAGSWSDIFRGFYRNWLQAGYHVGLYCSLSKYSLFDDKEMTTNGIYRWIADWDVDAAPSVADVWQYNCSTGLGLYQDKLDKDVDIAGKLVEAIEPTSHVTNPNGDYEVKAGAFVGFDYSTTALAGGKMLVASPDGINKIPKLGPDGSFILNAKDFEKIWADIKQRIKLPNVGDDIVHTADLANYAKTAYVDQKIAEIQFKPGPQGDKGDTGPQGPQGPAGKDGVTPDVSNLATKTDLANYYTKTETDTKLSTKADQAEYQTLNDKFNNMQIGGRNLLTGTQDWQGNWNMIASWSVDAEKYKGFTVRKHSIAWYNLGQYYDADPNTTYTFSFYAKTSEAGNFLEIFTLDKEDWSSPVVSVPAYANQAITTDWQRYSITFTTKSGGKIMPSVCSNKDGITIYVAGYKLEEGTVSTDWTPAPEDTITAIQKNATAIATLNSSAMQNRGTVDSPDFNSLTQAGFYTITSPSNGKNYPTGSWGTLEVSGQVTDGNGRLDQKYVGDNGGMTFTRLYNNGNKTWTAWAQVANQNDINTLNGKIATNSTQITDLQTAVKAQQSAAIDTSNVNTSKKPSDYSEGIFHEVKTVSVLGIDRSGLDTSYQQGSTAFVTTKKYSTYARQVAEVIDSTRPMTFKRNGSGSSWYSWEVDTTW